MPNFPVIGVYFLPGKNDPTFTVFTTVSFNGGATYIAAQRQSQRKHIKLFARFCWYMNMGFRLTTNVLLQQ